MQKKIFCPKVYPLNRDMRRRWFIRFFTKTEGVSVKHVIIIPKKLDAAARLRWAENYIKHIEKEGYAKEPPPAEHSYNQHIKLLFENLASKKIADKSRSAYLGHIRGLNAYCEKFHVTSIKEITAHAFLADLLTNHAERTVNSYRRSLSEAYEHLIKTGKVKRNPFRNTEKLKTKKAFSEHFTDKEVTLIIEGIKKHKPFLYLPAMVILHCATRNGREMPNIQIKDIDFETCRLWINETYSKNGEKEAVKIPQNLMKILYDNKINTYPPDYYLFSHTGIPSLKRVGGNFFQSHFKEVCQLVGCYKEGKGFYRLKNSLAVKMVKKNVSKFAIQRQFRHKTFNTTEKYLTSLQIDDFIELNDFSFF